MTYFADKKLEKLKSRKLAKILYGNQFIVILRKTLFL